jgi:2-keto-4-pentenoate hydratase/2-oxohepta-3-ene-1,7-dioic acid hydratase in catechol pathway
MKIIRYRNPAGEIYHASEQSDGSCFRIEGDIFNDFEITRETAEVQQILAPVVRTMVWCIGQNYRRHADETGIGTYEFPVVFAKGTNSLQNPGDPIRIPAHSQEIDYEGELVVVVGKACKDISRERALDYIAGYTCGNDVSARDWQLKKGGGQWCRGKSFDTFAPLGPCLVTRESIPNPNALRIRTTVNGKTRQDASTSEMIFDIPTLIEFLSQDTTLLPGTTIFTGTPHGIGMVQEPPLWLRNGDEVSVAREGIGTLHNPVRE